MNSRELDSVLISKLQSGYFSDDLATLEMPSGRALTSAALLRFLDQILKQKTFPFFCMQRAMTSRFKGIISA